MLGAHFPLCHVWSIWKLEQKYQFPKFSSCGMIWPDRKPGAFKSVLCCDLCWHECFLEFLSPGLIIGSFFLHYLSMKAWLTRNNGKRGKEIIWKKDNFVLNWNCKILLFVNSHFETHKKSWIKWFSSSSFENYKMTLLYQHTDHNGNHILSNEYKKCHN